MISLKYENKFCFHGNYFEGSECLSNDDCFSLTISDSNAFDLRLIDGQEKPSKRIQKTNTYLSGKKIVKMPRTP